MVDGHSSSRQRLPRAPVFLMVTIDGACRRIDAKLRNISAGGALVEGESLPPAGSRIVFRRKAIAAPGIVAWADGPFAGIRFDQPLEPQQVLRKISRPPSPMPRSESCRRPGFRESALTRGELEWARLWLPAQLRERFGE